MPFIEDPKKLQLVAFKVAVNAMTIKAHMLLEEAGLKIEDLNNKQQTGLVEKLKAWLDQSWPGLYDVAFEGGDLYLYQRKSGAKNLGYSSVSSAKHPSLGTSQFTYAGENFMNALEFPVYSNDSPQSEPVEVGNGMLVFPSFIRPKIIFS